MNTKSVSHPSIVPLDGANNFRDLSYYKGADNQKIKKKLLFRSDSLSKLSHKDCTLLSEKYGIKHIVDFRDNDEINAEPDKSVPGAVNYRYPASSGDSKENGNLQKLATTDWSTFNAEIFMLEVYRHLPFNNLGYKQLVKLLQKPGDGGIIQHCTLGKDRTGIGSALILFALGADESTVIEDYLLTQTILTPVREKMLAQYRSKLDDKALKQISYVLSAKEEFIQAALSSIQQRYGSKENWLQQEYGLDQAERAKLQAYYLE